MARSRKEEKTEEPKKKHAGGRPPIVIDPQQFESLCAIQCTLEEVAQVLNCSEDTIERWVKRYYGISFAEAYKKYSAAGRASLRRYQFALAKKNAGMAIFLGKNYLGQTDRQEVAVPMNGKLEELIDGLRQPHDIYAETAGVNGTVEDEPLTTD